MYIFEGIVYFPGVCLVQLHSSELSSSSSQHPENREIAQRCARTVYIFEEDCVCFECQTILPNCHPHHQLYSRLLVHPNFPKIIYHREKIPFLCQDIAFLVQMYKISSLSIVFLDQLICKKKSWNGLQSIAIFLWHHLFTWTRPSIIAIEHYLLAAFRPHVTFAT